MGKGHEGNKCINCNQCEFKCYDVKIFITHTLDVHGNNTEVIKCQHCEYKAIDKETMYEHIDTDHMELTLLGHITENQATLANKFESFKGELTDILNVIIDGHNAMKQEMFIMRQHEKIIDDKISKIDGAIETLNRKLEGKWEGAPKETQNMNVIKDNYKPSVPYPGYSFPKIDRSNRSIRYVVK